MVRFETTELRTTSMWIVVDAHRRTILVCVHHGRCYLSDVHRAIEISCLESDGRRKCGFVLVFFLALCVLICVVETLL